MDSEKQLRYHKAKESVRFNSCKCH